MTEPEITPVPNDKPHNEVDGKDAKKEDGAINVPLLLFVLLVSCLLLGTVSLAVRVNSVNKDGLTLLANIGVNVLIFAAIVVQAYIYRKQWQAMQAGLQEARMSREIENAAFIGMKGAIFEKPPLRAGERQRIIATIINTGRTVALNYRVEQGHSISAMGLLDFIPPFTDGVNPDPPRMVIPGVDSSLSFWIPALTQTDIDLLNGAKKYLIVWAKIEYEDIFGNPHWTTFSLFHHPGTTIFHPCAHGNDCDYRHPNGEKPEFGRTSPIAS